MIPELRWRKSSYCATNACVEVAPVDGGVLMRDSKNPGQAPIRFSREAWVAFLETVGGGTRDDL